MKVINNRNFKEELFLLFSLYDRLNWITNELEAVTESSLIYDRDEDEEFGLSSAEWYNHLEANRDEISNLLEIMSITLKNVKETFNE